MARKPEATFRTSVHKYLDGNVHRQPAGNAYSAGTPDTYYESFSSHLWVEWKFWRVVPPKFNLSEPVMKSHKTRLSELQLAWVNRAHGNNQFVAVITGCPKGGIIMIEREWTCDITRECFEHNILTRREIAQWIHETTAYPNGLRSKLILLPPST